jgi:hypothetical protein
VTATSFHLIGKETERGWEQNDDISTLMHRLFDMAPTLVLPMSSMLDRRGKVLAVTGPVAPSDAKLRRAQALAVSNGTALKISKELISQKLGHEIGSSANACQYCLAARASMRVTLSTLSALGNMALNRPIASAVGESCSMSRTSNSCPALAETKRESLNTEKVWLSNLTLDPQPAPGR